MLLSRQVLSLPAASRRSQYYGHHAWTSLSRQYHPLGTIPTTRLAHTARHSRHLPFLVVPSFFRLHSTTSENALTEEVRIPYKFVSYPFEYHREVTIRIDTMTNLGVGIAGVNLTDHDPVVAAKSQRQDPDSNTTTMNNDDAANDKQWVIMVRNVIPGEVVKARIFRNHKKYSEADLIQVVEPSEHRIEPLCPLAGECGGCQYQHMPIDLQRTWKTTHVEACFQQHNVDLQQFNMIVQKTMGTDQIYHYRSKITPHYQAPQGTARRNRNRGPKNGQPDTRTNNDDDKPMPTVQAIGFQRSSQKSIIDVPYCPIATKPLNDEYQKMRKELLHQSYQTSLGATLLLRQGNVNNDTVVTDNNEYITTDVNGISFTYQAGNFFQNNLYILPRMVDTVMEWASPPDHHGVAMTHFVDCYCGSGLFCLSAAQHFETCVGIEIQAKAIQEANYNAAANNLSHKCTFEASRAEAIFFNPQVQTFPRDTTVVMLDPPRKGCDEAFLKQLEAFRPQRIVYLSCDPATQARDVKDMVSWGYDITFVQPFDLFPQTRHIECLAVLERR